MAGNRRTTVRRVGRIASGAAFACAAAAALLVLLPAAFGWQRYAIVSGSMTGTYDRGSLVIDDVVPVADLEAGDVITYRPPAGDHLVTHRIAWTDVRMGLIGLPALAIAAFSLAGLWRRLGALEAAA
jgi:signal peptidase